MTKTIIVVQASTCEMMVIAAFVVMSVAVSAVVVVVKNISDNLKEEKKMALLRRGKDAFCVWHFLKPQPPTALCEPLPEIVFRCKLVLTDVCVDFGRAPPAKLEEQLGSGLTSVVCLCSEDVVVKVSCKGYEELLRDEARRLRVGVKGVVPMLGCGSANGGSIYWITMPRLYPVPEALTEHEAVIIGIHARRALLCLHEAGMVHGDVSLKTMLYDGRDLATVVLADLGHANAVLQQEMYRPFYAQNNVLSGELAPRSDLYALGCVLLQAVNRVPWDRVQAEAQKAVQVDARSDLQRMVQALLLTV